MAISTIGTNSLSDPIAVNATGALTGTVNGYTPTASNMQPFNRIINGAMTIDQRNAGASVTATNAGYTLDRWKTLSSAASKFTVQRSTTAPTGFIYSALITSSSAYAVGVSEAFVIEQVIEGFNISDLGWGTANAVPATLTFQVRSSLTGTFGGVIKPASYDYTFPFTYTIAVANTWETKTINVAGPTVATFGTGITDGARVMFGLGVGSTSSGTADGTWGSGDFYSATGATSVVGTSGATFYITGVQLEAGSTASPFAHENYGDTLQKCQRYYEWGGASGSGYAAVTAIFDAGSTSSIDFKVSKRAVPTMTNMSLSGNQYPNNAGNSVPRYENGYGRSFRYTTEHNTTFWNNVSGSGGTQGTSAGHQIIWNASAEL